MKAKNIIQTALLTAGLCVQAFAGEVTVTSVAAHQRYPWNGLVDIAVTLQGTAEDVAERGCIFSASNCATREAIRTDHITCNGDDIGSGSVWTRKFIWDAKADVGVVKIDDVALSVFVGILVKGGVQLWENGPYWAECNVGATKPEEFGYYFWWGDTVGYKRNANNNGWISVKDSTSFSFDTSSCPTCGKDNSQLRSAGYIDSRDNLVAKYDAATANLGMPWRMPTDAEFSALINNCTAKWTTRNGVSGRLVTGKGAYLSKSIFLPAAGYGGSDSRLVVSGSRGYYWSSTIAWYLYFRSSTFTRSDGAVSLYCGHSVRPVRESAITSVSGPMIVMHLSLDCRTGDRVSAGTEELTFSNLWDGDKDATVTIAQDGAAIFSGLSGEGVMAWVTKKSGRYELTHTTYTNGIKGKVETAVFVVEGKEVLVGELTIDWGQKSFVYDGQPKEPVITVMDGETTLTKGTHYLVEYKDNINVGTAKAIVKGVEPYVGEVTNTFEITKATIPGGGKEPGGGSVPEGGVSKFDTVAMYDGVAHTIKTNDLVAAFRAAIGNDFAVRFAVGESGGLGQPALPPTDEGAWGTVAPAYTDVGEYVVWYKVSSANYEDFVHQAKVRVTKRAMSEVLVSDPGVIDYTGAAITPFVTVSDGSPSIVKASDYTVSYADNVQPGTARIILTATAGGNYTGTKTVPFTIRKTTFDIDDGTGGEGGKNSKFSYAGVYDGKGHGINVKVENSPAGMVIKYSRGQPDKVPGGTWSTVNPLYTDVCDNVVWYAVECAGYISYTNNAMVTITPKPLKVAAEAKTQVYGETAKPLTYTTVGLETGDALTGALTREPGDDVGEYDILQGTLANGNYTINYTGAKYTITKGTIPGGGEEPGEGTIPEGGLSKFDRTGVYNGKGQTIDVEKLAVAFAPYTSGQESASPFRFAVSADGPWSEEPPTITTVGELVVWYKVTSPNYEDYVHQTKVTVVPKVITDEMVQPGEDAFFFDGDDKKPTVDVQYFVDGKDICTPDDYDGPIYGEKAGAGWWVTVTGKGNYTGSVTKIVPVLKRPVAPPVITSKSYTGKTQKPTIPTDSRWTVVANPGGVEVGEYPNVVLRITDTENYKWKGGAEDETDITLVFKVTKGNNGWSRQPDMKGWTYGETPNEPSMGQARYGTVKVAYRKAGADVSTETATRPELPGKYLARFWVDETENFIGVAVHEPYKDIAFEITGSALGDTETTTTPVPVPHDWLDAYVAEFGGGDYETAANAKGKNGVSLWESYVAGLDPTDPTSQFKASITMGVDGRPVITWEPDMTKADPPRVYVEYGKANLGDKDWTLVTDANREVMRFFKVGVEVK